jgi:hypothetical protein
VQGLVKSASPSAFRTVTAARLPDAPDGAVVRMAANRPASLSHAGRPRAIGGIAERGASQSRELTSRPGSEETIPQPFSCLNEDSLKQSTVSLWA